MKKHPAAAFFVFTLLTSAPPLHARDETPVVPASPVTNVIEAGASPVTEASPVTPVREAVARPVTRANEEDGTQAEMAKLKDEMRKAAAENERAQGELKAAIETLERENADLKKAAVNRMNERNALVQKLAAAQLAAQEKSKAADAVTNVSAELAAARATIDSLNAELKKREQELAGEKGRADRAEAQARESVGETNEKLASAQAGMSALRAELAAARQESTALEERMQTLAEENRRISAQMGEERSKTAQATDAVAQSLATAQQEASAAQIENSTLKARLSVISAQNETIARERDEALAASDALKARLKSTEDALADAGKARDELAQRVTALEKQNADAGEAAAAAADDLRKQISDGEVKLGAALGSHQLKLEEFDALQKRFDEATGENANLSGRLQKLEAKLAETERRASANEQAAAQMIVLRENFRQLQIQSADAAEENVRLKTRLALLAQTQAQPAGAPSRPAPQAPAAQPQAVALPQPPAAAAGGAAPDSNARTHTVAAGETLWSIARKYHGSSEQWNAIYEANRDQLKSPDALMPGMKLVIP